MNTENRLQDVLEATQSNFYCVISADRTSETVIGRESNSLFVVVLNFSPLLITFYYGCICEYPQRLRAKKQ